MPKRTSSKSSEIAPETINPSEHPPSDPADQFPLFSKRQSRKTSKQRIPPEGDKPVYKRVTYYVRPETAKKIKLLAVLRDMEISELVREILESYLRKQREF